MKLPVGNVPEILAHEFAHLIVGDDGHDGHGPEWERVNTALLSYIWADITAKAHMEDEG